MFHHQKNPIRRLHVAAQTKKNELLYLTKSRYKFFMVHVCSFRISRHLFKNSDTQGLASVWLFSHYQQKKKKYRTLLCLTTKQQLSSAQFPMSKATVFVFVDRCHVHTAYMCVKMAYMY